MINTHWLELPLSQTNFHGPKAVRAIEVQLYLVLKVFSTLEGILKDFKIT